MTDAYKLQILEDHLGVRLHVDGPHALNMFRPEAAETAVPILQAGHICWVRPGDVNAVAAALGPTAELPGPTVFIADEVRAL